MAKIKNAILQQLWANRSGRIAIIVLLALGSLALFAPVLANSLPYYVFFQGKVYFPFFQPNLKINLQQAQDQALFKTTLKDVNWYDQKLEKAYWAPVPYSPSYNDYPNRLRGPFDQQIRVGEGNTKTPLSWRFRHWLGTENGGKDILAILIHGGRVSLLIGLVGMGLAGIIGLLLGSMAGYFGNDRFETRKGFLVGIVIFLIPMWFYGYYVRRYLIESAFEASLMYGLLQSLISILIVLTLGGLGWMLGIWLQKWSWAQVSVKLPIDLLIMRLMELLKSIPLIIILIWVIHQTEHQFWLSALVIGLFSWVSTARLVRGDMMHVAHMPYIEVARLQGFSDWYIMIKHAIPNALTSFWIILAFGVGNVIMAEAALVFLGLDTDATMISWGELLSSRGADIVDKWWIVVFPGFTIFFVVLACNILGEKIRDLLDTKMLEQRNQ